MAEPETNRECAEALVSRVLDEGVDCPLGRRLVEVFTKLMDERDAATTKWLNDEIQASKEHLQKCFVREAELRMATDVALMDLQAAVRKHRDSYLSGDDKCWQDNETLYKALPEGYTPPARDTTVEIENCRRYLASCHDPRVEYVSPQRRIEELEQALRYAASCSTLEMVRDTARGMGVIE